jgi:RNA polymerase-binding transcription factor DksA
VVKAAPKKVAKPVAKKVVAKAAPKKAAKPVAKKVVAKAAPKKVVKPVAKKVVAKAAPKKVAKPVAKKAAVKVVAKPLVKKAPVKAAPVKVVKAPAPKKPEVKKVEVKKAETKKVEVIKNVKAPIKSKPIVSPNVKIEAPTIAANANIVSQRYSDSDLKEFEGLIREKLVQAKSDLDELKQSLSHEGDNSTDDTSPTFKMMEDGTDTTSREEVAQLAARQEKFIQSLENALLRIKNKTYGICRVTGKLIPKERLRLVPHATLSIEAKNMQ